MYVEPCCADNQMPAILKENEVFFNTSGDITVQHMMKAVSFLAGLDIEMTLMIDTVTDELLGVIRHYVNRGWIKKINLFVKTDCKKQLKTKFDGMLNIINYSVDETLTENLLAFNGTEGDVLIVGKMLCDVAPGFYVYSGKHFKNGRKFDDIMEPFMAKFKSMNKKI